MWYWIIAVIVTFITVVIIKSYLVKNKIQTSIIDYYEGGSIFGPIFVGLFWPIALIGGLCFLIYKKLLKKHYQRFVKWLGDILFPDI